MFCKRKKMAYNKRKIGAQYERAAGAFLEKSGYQILKYNYRCPLGEIDLIAKEDGYLVFCEVKYRRDAASGHAAEAVDKKKQRTISRCASYYLMEHADGDVPCRFDVVSIENGDLRVIKNAFDYVG